MNFPAELKYSKSHEWVKMDGDVAVIGISDFAQDALGDVVFINLPAEGDSVTAGESFGDVESVKAVSDVICPVSGTICEVNEALADAPETLTGDMPTPVKYYSPHIREAYAQVEQSACEHLVSMLPEDLRADFAPFFFKDESDEELWKLVKAADKICAYIKCIEEKKAGNTEFDRAAESTLESINALDIPEAEEFMKEFLDGYRLTLDEIKE